LSSSDYLVSKFAFGIERLLKSILGIIDYGLAIVFLVLFPPLRSDVECPNYTVLSSDSVGVDTPPVVLLVIFVFNFLGGDTSGNIKF
jgi:hypothetical protein